MSVTAEEILATMRAMPKLQRTVILCSPEGMRSLLDSIPEGQMPFDLASMPAFVAYSALEAWKIYREETEAGSRVLLCGWALAGFPDFDLKITPLPPCFFHPTPELSEKDEFFTPDLVSRIQDRLTQQLEREMGALFNEVF